MVTGEMLGQAAGATIVAIATAYGIWRGHKKGDGKAPDSNVISIVIGLFGVYCSLKARQLLLAEEEQKHWHWLIAWAHPRLLGFPRGR